MNRLLLDALLEKWNHCPICGGVLKKYLYKDDNTVLENTEDCTDCNLCYSEFITGYSMVRIGDEEFNWDHTTQPDQHKEIMEKIREAQAAAKIKWERAHQ